MKELLYFKFYKPHDVISTLSDPKNRTCLKKYMHKIPKGVFPVGRLDRKTTGLMLFTNDGDFANKILHPKYKIPKTYLIQIDKDITKAHIKRLIMGLFLEDGPTCFEEVELLDKRQLKVIISEGRNRIIRRSFELLGYTVLKLKRIKIGLLTLDKMKIGNFKKLTIKEKLSFKKYT